MAWERSGQAWGPICRQAVPGNFITLNLNIMPAWLLPAIGMGVNALGQWLSGKEQHNQNQAARDFSLQMYQTQRRDALDDWNMVSQYNSPQAQMDRYKAAGLNPNLIYGQQNNSPVVRSSDMAPYRPEAARYSGEFAQQGFMQIYDMRVKDAQINSLQAQLAVQQQDAILRAAQVANTVASTSKTEQDTAQGKFNLSVAEQLKGITLETAAANLQKMLADTKYTINQDERAAATNAMSLREAGERILNYRMDRAKTQDERAMIRNQMQLLPTQLENMKKEGQLKDLDINLKKIGVQPGDNLVFRILAQLFGGSSQAPTKPEAGRHGGIWGIPEP